MCPYALYLSLHLHVTHSLNFENVLTLILLGESKKSLDFSIHHSTINVSMRSVPSLKSLNESKPNFSVANILIANITTLVLVLKLVSPPAVLVSLLIFVSTYYFVRFTSSEWICL